MRLALLLLAFVAALAAPPQTAMAFCAPSDVEDAYDDTRLAQRTGDPQGTAVDQAVLSDAVDTFAAVMAPYVRGRYGDVDFAQAEPTLNEINVEGAWLTLAKSRPLGMSDGDREDYATLLKRLQHIADGRVALELPDGVDLSTGSIDPEAAFRSNPRQFGRRTWTPPAGTA